MSTEAPVGARPQRRPDLWLRQSGGENAVYNQASGAVHLLNETAWAIWGLCDGRTSPDEMIDAICEISSLPRDVVAEDVRRVLEDFDQADLVSWVK